MRRLVLTLPFNFMVRGVEFHALEIRWPKDNTPASRPVLYVRTLGGTTRIRGGGPGFKDETYLEGEGVSLNVKPVPPTP